jgi:hypothetical protein
MILVVVATDGRLFERPVRALNLTVRPRILRLCQAMIDVVRRAGILERVRPDWLASCERLRDEGCRGYSVAGCGEVDSVISQDRVDLVRNGLSGLPGIRRRRGSWPSHATPRRRTWTCGRSRRTGRAGPPRFGPPRCRHEIADRVALELAPVRLVASDVRQAADAVALQAAMQGRAGQVRIVA